MKRSRSEKISQDQARRENDVASIGFDHKSGGSGIGRFFRDVRAGNRIGWSDRVDRRFPKICVVVRLDSDPY